MLAAGSMIAEDFADLVHMIPQCKVALLWLKDCFNAADGRCWQASSGLEQLYHVRADALGHLVPNSPPIACMRASSLLALTNINRLVLSMTSHDNTDAMALT